MKSTVEVTDRGIVMWDGNHGYRINPIGSWHYTNNRGKLWCPVVSVIDVPKWAMDALAEHDRRVPLIAV